MPCSRLLFCSLLLTPCVVLASDVELVGLFGNRAVLTIDEGKPQTLLPGQRSKEGVRLIEVHEQAVIVEIDGEQRRLNLGEAPVRIGESTSSEVMSTTLRLAPDLQGHYWTQGAVNGASARFMVDTGATFVAISAETAKRAGIDYRAGRRVRIDTANGEVIAYLVTLDRISAGGIVLYGVEATVHEAGLEIALLGMSFIRRLDIQRESGSLVFRKRY